MTLAERIQICLEARGWNPATLTKRAGIKSVQAITRVLKGERKGMHSDNLDKLEPFLPPRQVQPIDSQSQEAQCQSS